MKKAFSARQRVPRKIGGDDDGSSLEGAGDADSSESTLKRPTSTSRSTKPRKSSALRTSFGPSSLADEEASGRPPGVVTPKRSNLSRVAIQRNASKRASALSSHLPGRRAEEKEEDADDDRPSYNAAALQELRDSTPTTPRDAGDPYVDDVASNGTRALDLSSKFGSSLSRYQHDATVRSSAIPSAAEIEEKKARRARLAKEQAAEEYISLDPDDNDNDNDDDDDDYGDNVTRDETGRLILKPKDKYNQAESRLTRDDEDVLEGFDDFTEPDSRLLLSRRAESEAAHARKREMAAQIAAAEGGGGGTTSKNSGPPDPDSDPDSDSDSSERERNQAFEAAQTRHGTYSSSSTTTIAPPPSSSAATARPTTPPTISPLPTLDGVLARLHARLDAMRRERARSLREMDALRAEKVRLAEEEVRIQLALRETAGKFAALRVEKGIAVGGGVGGGNEELELEEATTLGLGSLVGGGGNGGGGGGEDGGGGDGVVVRLENGREGLGLGFGGGGLGEDLGSSSSAVDTPRAVGDGGGDESDESRGVDSDGPIAT